MQAHELSAKYGRECERTRAALALAAVWLAVAPRETKRPKRPPPLDGAAFATVFLAAGFLAAGFLATGFLATGFLATFFVETTRPTTFFGAVFFMTFLGAAFFAATALRIGFFFGPALLEPPNMVASATRIAGLLTAAWHVLIRSGACGTKADTAAASTSTIRDERPHAMSSEVCHALGCHPDPFASAPCR